MVYTGAYACFSNPAKRIISTVTLFSGAACDIADTSSKKPDKPDFFVAGIANCFAAGTLFVAIGSNFSNEYFYENKSRILQNIESVARRGTKGCFLASIGALSASVYCHILKTNTKEGK